jgi:hypothetical protein
MLSILNSLAKYFHMTNEALPKCDGHDSIEQKPIYVIFEGSKSGVYISFEENNRTEGRNKIHRRHILKEVYKYR